MLKQFRKKLVAWLGPSLAYWTITILGWTMKFEEVRPEIRDPFGKRESTASAHSGTDEC